MRLDGIALAALELFGEAVVPQVAADVEDELVGEEEVESLPALAGEILLEFAVELLDDVLAEMRVHRVDGAGDCFDFDLAVLIDELFAHDLRVLFEDRVHVPALAGRGDGVVAQRDGDPALLALVHEPADERPPLVRKEAGVAVHRQAVVFAAGVAVAVVDLQRADVAARELVELPEQPPLFERLADPPAEGDLPVFARGILKAFEHGSSSFPEQSAQSLPARAERVRYTLNVAGRPAARKARFYPSSNTI